MEGKIIIVSAPSGCGKSTIINRLLQKGEIDMEFSVSATNRQPREGEVHGVSYWFLTDEEFRQAIADDNFVEYEEVYPGRFYGTLKSEVERRCREGHNVVLDIDVKGGVNVKRLGKAEYELSFAPSYDIRIVNDDLDKAVADTEKAIKQFVGA